MEMYVFVRRCRYIRVHICAFICRTRSTRTCSRNSTTRTSATCGWKRSRVSPQGLNPLQFASCPPPFLLPLAFPLCHLRELFENASRMPRNPPPTHARTHTHTFDNAATMAQAHAHTSIRTPTYQYPANTLRVLRESGRERGERERARARAAQRQ